MQKKVVVGRYGPVLEFDRHGGEKGVRMTAEISLASETAHEESTHCGGV